MHASIFNLPLAAPLAAFAAFVAFSAQAAGELPCPPVALIEGPSPIAGPTRAILREHGVRSQPNACPGRLLRASFVAGPDPGEYTLRIDDGLGRLNDRQASDPETAASLIESWLFDEDAVLLAPKPEPVPSPSASAPAAVAHRASPMLAAAVPALAGWRVFGAGELAADSDETRWYGGSAAACRNFGFVCIGGRARLLRAQGWQSPYGLERDETGADALTLATIPIHLGRITLLPIAGVGLGATRFVAVRDWEVMSRDRLFVRGDVSLILDVAVAHRWSLFAEVGTSAGQQLGGDQRERPPGPDPVRAPSDVALRLALGLGYAP